MHDYSDWLRANEWDFVSTLTTRDSFSMAALRRAAQKHLDQVRPTEAFWVAESGALYGQNHLHVLYRFRNYGSDCVPNRSLISSAWSHGITDVQRYDPSAGFASYMAKHLAYDNIEYDYWAMN